MEICNWKEVSRRNCAWKFFRTRKIVQILRDNVSKAAEEAPVEVETDQADHDELYQDYTPGAIHPCSFYAKNLTFKNVQYTKAVDSNKNEDSIRGEDVHETYDLRKNTKFRGKRISCILMSNHSTCGPKNFIV